MGIQVEFNPDLALRNIVEFKNDNRKVEECIPETLESGKEYSFLKSDQRNYWLLGELPLVETEGEGRLSKPKAGIVITEATHFLVDDRVYTKGKYKVIEVFDDDQVHFDGFTKIKL